MRITGKGNLGFRFGTVRSQDLFLSGSTYEVRGKKDQAASPQDLFLPRSHTGYVASPEHL